MNVTLEMSLYPLNENYKSIILNFIAQLHEQDEVKVITNGMSTQLFGTYDAVMQLVTPAIKQIYEENEQAMFVMKMGKGIQKFK